MEFLVIVGLIIGVSLISTLAQFKITQIATSEIASRVQELNEALGEAIQMVGAGAQPGESPNGNTGKGAGQADRQPDLRDNGGKGRIGKVC